jgi:hypothetical protein
MVPPPLTQNARAAYVLADQITQGRRDRAFALVNTATLGNGYGQYYMTLLTAPAEIFPQALLLMTEVRQVVEYQPGRDDQHLTGMTLQSPG